MTTESLGILAALYVITALAIAFGHYYYQPSKAAPQRKTLGKLTSYAYGTLAYGIPFGIYLLHRELYTIAAIFAGFVAVAGSVTIYTNYMDRQAAQEKNDRDAERRYEIAAALHPDRMDGD